MKTAEELRKITSKAEEEFAEQESIKKKKRDEENMRLWARVAQNVIEDFSDRAERAALERKQECVAWTIPVDEIPYRHNLSADYLLGASSLIVKNLINLGYKPTVHAVTSGGVTHYELRANWKKQ